ncbi:VOC family protein [Streptomyces formicae]|uniref:Putative hydroxylase n=1 Tax=Streptomyces formicae TaxID=1616117 RepID=A0A291QKN3_9ACTN|nr:VOC family protein [Streptomyces formicae]ATL32087.1 putative hydroxylase [Streptomyces formicae]
MLNNRFVTGAPVWVDMCAPDLGTVSSFYRELFGWELQQGGPEVGGYGQFRIGGRTAAGAMAVSADEAPPSWTLYFRTPEADATVKSVEQAGGRTLFEAVDITDLGRMAGLADSAGVPFSVWQQGQLKGLDVLNEPGGLIWVELYTPDVAAATAFYGSVFGWGTTEMPFPGGSYTMVHPADGTPDDMFGGLVPLDTDPAESTPYWLPYFQVDDCDGAVVTARGAGGEVRMEPVSMEGVGRFAKLADPAGARFAVLQPSPPGEQTGA